MRCQQSSEKSAKQWGVNSQVKSQLNRLCDTVFHSVNVRVCARVAVCACYSTRAFTGMCLCLTQFVFVPPPPPSSHSLCLSLYVYLCLSICLFLSFRTLRSQLRCLGQIVSGPVALFPYLKGCTLHIMYFSRKLRPGLWCLSKALPSSMK